MIVEYTRYKIDIARRNQFEGAYNQAQQVLSDSPHCLSYELSHCVEKPEHYILRIEWDSTEGHLKGFRTSPAFQDFFAAVRPFFQEIEEMEHYEVTAIRGSKNQ
jgi:quinol monooxygenase YgiN